MAEESLKVLCVADDDSALAQLHEELQPEFNCTAAPSIAAAIDAMRTQGPFAVVVADFSVTAADCNALFREIQARWPDSIGIAVIWAAAVRDANTATDHPSVYRRVRKPWRAEEILTAVREAAAYSQLVANERHLRDQLARTNAELDQKIQDLDEANELLEYWVEFSPAVLYSISCESGVLHPSYISKNFHRLTGFERTAAVIDAKFWPDLIYVDDRSKYLETVVELADFDRSHAVIEYRIRHRDGNFVTIVDSMRAVRDGDGETVELVGAWLDVTERN